MAAKTKAKTKMTAKAKKKPKKKGPGPSDADMAAAIEEGLKEPLPIDDGDEHMDMGLLRKFVALRKQLRHNEHLVEGAKAQLAELVEQLLPQFEACGVQNMNVDDMCVFIHRQVWAGYGPDLGPGATGDDKAAAKQALVDALRGDEEWAFLVTETFNTQSLSARVRELDEDADGMPVLPEFLQGVMKITEKFDLRARKAAKK